MKGCENTCIFPLNLRASHEMARGSKGVKVSYPRFDGHLKREEEG